jgi:pimeloyl-ACP methyl ester carboxylesterase
MQTGRINGVNLAWERTGERGEPLVLVHGSWGDHHNWDPVVPALSRMFRVYTYDRRGHSNSERLAGQGSIEEDVQDLAAFITTNGLAPAHVAGNSFGAAITLKLAAARPDLFASASAHEPPLIGMLENHPALPAVQQRIRGTLDVLESGDMEAGARYFVENVALGPGMWDRLPPAMRRTFVFNAPTWMDEMREPATAMTVELHRLATFERPLLLTRGDQSPPFFYAILDRIAAATPGAEQHTFHGAGHVPHLTHSEEYVQVLTEFAVRGTPRKTP